MYVLSVTQQCTSYSHSNLQYNEFRKRVKNAVTSKGIQVGLSVNKWSDVKCSDVGWTDVIYVKCFCFEFKWSEVSYGEVLGDKSTIHIMVTLYWDYLIVLWIFHLVCILYCGWFKLFCNVWVCVCVFVMCGYVYVWVL
jgi:hypothetical protein